MKKNVAIKKINYLFGRFNSDDNNKKSDYKEKNCLYSFQIFFFFIMLKSIASKKIILENKLVL